MKPFILRRLAAAAVAVLAVTALVFVAVRVVPGDPVAAMFKNPTAEQVEAHRRRLGLDRPVAIQYLYFLRDLVTGDLGESFENGRPVADELKDAFPATLELAALAILLAVFGGVSMGVLAARRQGRTADLVVSGASVAGVSIPVFLLGLLLMNLMLRWLEPGRRLSPGLFLDSGPTGLYLIDSLLAGRPDVFANALAHLILPAVTLATVPGAIIARMTRSSLLDVLNEDYIRTARAKGLSERAVVWRHALKNAIVPVATAGGVQTGYLLAGAVLTETVFSWPGLGRYVADAVFQQNMPAVQGSVVLIAVTFMAINLATDFFCAWIDPRIASGSRLPSPDSQLSAP